MSLLTVSLISPFLWLLMACIELPIMLVGWVVIPVMAGLGRYSLQYNITTGYYDKKKVLLWNDSFMAPWQNYEDGIAAGLSYYKAPSTFLQILYWSAVRNPASGTRWMSPLLATWKAGEVQYRGSFGTQRDRYDSTEEQWFFAWKGAKAGLYIVKRLPLLGLRRLFVGWALYPTDSVQSPWGYRVLGAGFKMQFRKLD